jgi:hypothetical protein
MVLGCLPGPQCSSLSTPPTVVSVKAGSSPVCGATVTATRVFDDATVGPITFVEEVDDGACTGTYTNFLNNTATWTIEVAKAGFMTATVSVAGPAPVDCNHSRGAPQQQQVLVNLSP